MSEETENEQVESSAEAVTEDFDMSALSDEEVDAIADSATETLRAILDHFGFDSYDVDEYEGDEGELILDVVGDDMSILIGRHGKTLEALQILVSAITRKKMKVRYPVVIDVEGYKGRMRQKLEGLAHSSAKKAKSQHRAVSLRPMSAYERRIVHVALRDEMGISTHSEGTGGGRHVVVEPE